jgi:voltage-gated sodium channel
MVEAAKALFWVMILLMICLYVWAIILTITVGQNEDSKFFDYSQSYWKKDDYWGSVPASMYSLFQLMTRDSWSMNMIRPVVIRIPGLVILFLAFFCVVSFGLMNIIVGVVVENTMACAKENEEKMQQLQDSEQTRVLESLKAIFEASDTNGDGTLDREEFINGMKKKEVKERLATIDIPIQDLNELYDLLDENQDKSITIQEFFKGCEKLKGVAKSRDIIDLSVKVSMYLQMSTELQHGKKCQYKDRSGEPCQNRAIGRWVQDYDSGTGDGKWVFDFCEKHGGFNHGESEGPPRGLKQQGEVLERVMERLEIMDKEFLRTEDVGRRRRKRKPGPGSP